MSQIKVIPCPIEGLYVIEPSIHNDKRGLFFESYNAKEMEAYGLRREFVQDNESYSVKGVLRGLHFQKEHSQCKICRVIDGAVFDVAVDLRGDSPTYGQWYGAYLSSERSGPWDRVADAFRGVPGNRLSGRLYRGRRSAGAERKRPALACTGIFRHPLLRN